MDISVIQGKYNYCGDSKNTWKLQTIREGRNEQLTTKKNNQT
jgi:hypothetical protein